MIPPPGLVLSFADWNRRVNVNITKRLPDIRVSGTARTVTWTLGLLRARVTPEGNIWWVRFERGGGFAMPPLCVDRHDDFTARNVAKTMMGFFDAALSRPDDDDGAN